MNKKAEIERYKETARRFFKTGMLFVAGALGYGLMEILWRGYTHYSMLVAGGIVLVGAYLINRHNEGAPLFFRAFAVMLFIITVELIFGVVFNMFLGMRVWDYSNKPFNYFGQICLDYSFLWLIISTLLCLVIGKLLKLKRK